MTKVSVIVPTHNSEESIERSVGSVLSQTLQDIELIAIDDGSSDNTFDLLSQLKSKSKIPFQLIRHERNMSASLARKTGLEASQGDFVMFLDSDDSLSPVACATAYQGIVSSGVDVLQFGTNVKDAGVTTEQFQWFADFVDKAPPGKVFGNLAAKCFEQNLFGFSLWNKIYRSRSVKLAALSIPSVPLFKAQDLLLQFHVLARSSVFLGIPDKLYDYSYGSGITGKSPSNKHQVDIHLSQAAIVQILWAFVDKNRLFGYYRNSLQSIARFLVEDNIAMIGALKNQDLKSYAKTRFFTVWQGTDFLGDAVSNGSYAEFISAVLRECQAMDRL